MESVGVTGDIKSIDSSLSSSSVDVSRRRRRRRSNEEIEMNKKKKKSISKATSRPHFKIEWRELSYYHKQGSFVDRFLGKVAKSKQETAKARPSKRILNSLDGCFRSGELSAILGPSGAGKSTFLRTLFGSKQESSQGQTRVTWFCEQTGQPLSSERRSIKIASLPQHDHLLNHLTVYESLMFASKIKNAELSDLSKTFHRQNVKRVAKMLNLTDCLDTRCGKLSGGQYKRVSIGQELLSEPDVIILDEPTSGLDAMTCLTTIQTLKSIVMKQPMSIILTIHQPDIDVFNLFDHVYVIAQGGVAIYEGPPQGIIGALAAVDLQTPSANYNPARFIVEHAFLEEPPDLAEAPQTQLGAINTDPSGSHEDEYSSASSDEDEEDEDDRDLDKQSGTKEYLRKSVLSLTEIIGGKEMSSGGKPLSKQSGRQDKKPLLNIGIQTLDGKLITSEQLARTRQEQQRCIRWELLKRLNQNQKSKYRNRPLFQMKGAKCGLEQSFFEDDRFLHPKSTHKSAQQYQSKTSKSRTPSNANNSDYHSHSSSSSSNWSGRAPVVCQLATKQRAASLANLPAAGLQTGSDTTTSHDPSSGRSLQTMDKQQRQDFVSVSFSVSQGEHEVDEYYSSSRVSNEEHSTTADVGEETKPLRRNFDKRLSAKHNCSKQRNQPIWYHTFLLAHRTWLSIVRDPIFFGIQACMHTIIPVLLALIFGSAQEEGCPRVGNFDLVEFAYSDSANMIQRTVSSIRQSIGNIGIVFFEMFVLSFSINCITALVFPLDMYVLLKEYRNGWYSLRSYLFGRTLADLPVPVVLHSLAMAILCHMTGQPLNLWRFSAIVALVILASLVAQSVGLTIGALLMKSSQSAVLAAAGIVAPFFALSGFIVRIHTLPIVAQVAAKLSYLYHLLNGFIIIRYGFGRCECSLEDFEQNKAHQIPNNLHTMASMWIGTYSDEFADSSAVQSVAQNRTNVDPNIDVVEKMLHAFKMANSYGHQISNCSDVVPYAMLDFNLRDQDIYHCFLVLVAMLILSRIVTFAAIYYKVRSYT